MPVRAFMQGLRSLDWPWQVWVLALGAVNVVGGFAYIARPEGRATLLAMAVAMGVMVGVVRARGFVRLLGIGHLVAWGPLLAWLVLRFDSLPATGGLRRWVVALVVVNGLSLVIDALDVVRYARGERAPM